MYSPCTRSGNKSPSLFFTTSSQTTAAAATQEDHLIFFLKLLKQAARKREVANVAENKNETRTTPKEYSINKSEGAGKEISHSLNF